MIWLLFAHYIGDIALQSDWQAQNKGRLWYVMFSHCMIWTACVSVALQYQGRFDLWKVVFLVIGHWVCDKWKTTKPKTPEAWKYIYPDQAWHIIQLAIVYSFDWL
jgi:hypothetical protein